MRTIQSKGLWLGGLLALGMAGTALAQSEAEPDRRFYVAPMASYGFFDDDDVQGMTVDPEDSVGGTLVIGKPLGQYLNVEAHGFYFGGLEEEGTGNLDYDIYGYGVDALLFPARDSFPVFGILGLSTGEYDPENASGVIQESNGDGDADFIDFGVGFLFPFTQYGLAVRGEYRYRKTDIEVNQSQDLDFDNHVVSLGIQIPLGAPPAEPEPEPEPAPPPPPEPLDSDNDGVINKNDDCPGTPEGTEVGENGCPIEKAEPIVLKGVRFEYDSAKLTAEAEQRLDNVINALKGTEIRIRLEGHTDSKGTEAYNQALSQRRIDSVKAYLLDHGIDPSRIASAKGFGESQPVAPNTDPDGSDNPEGRAKNRRVELEVVEE